jgi:hypothetical protein
MLVRFLGAPHLQAYQASGVDCFASPIGVGEVRDVPEVDALRVLDSFPGIFVAVEPEKAAAPVAPVADKQVKAPARKKG